MSFTKHKPDEIIRLKFSSKMSIKNEGNGLFPVFLKIGELKTLIVGGGNVGLEKLEALLKNNPEAKVKLIGTTIKQEIKDLANEHGSIDLIERSFKSEDLEDAEVVILATDDNHLHAKIRLEAKSRKLLVNVADTPHLCDFYLGSTVKKGNLKIGISTNGKSPTLSKRLREMLEEILPEEIDELLDNLQAIRDDLKGDFAYKVQKLNEVTSILRSEKRKEV